MTVFGRQIKLARKLIDKYGDKTAILRTITLGTPSDPSKPWQVGNSTFVDNVMPICFLLEHKRGWYSETRKEGELIADGLEYCLIASNGVVPKLNDVIIRKGVQMKIRYVQALAPDSTDIIYKLGVMF